MPSVKGPPLALDQEALNNPPSLLEQTRGQVSIWGLSPNREALGTVNQDILPLLVDPVVGSSHYYRKVRMMRKHPTVRLVRLLSIASMAAAPWSVTVTDKAPEGAKDLISTLLPMQSNIMSAGLRGKFDFGWAPFEKVWKFNKDTCNYELRKLKPLLQDQTQIMIESKNGDFAGFKQFHTGNTGFLGVSNALLLSQDVEGTYWYGEGTMPSVEFAYNRWLVTDESNVRYDKKVSGAHWIIHFPEGQSPYAGTVMDNFTIANKLMESLQGSGSFIVPRTVMSQVSDLNGALGAESAWLIELKEASGGAQMSFESRMRYLDNLIVRAGEFPERSILEGLYGTKADADSHADFAVARMDFRNREVIGQLNPQLVDQMLRMNYGEEAEGTVKLEVAPIADDAKVMMKQIYMSVLSNPQMSAGELAAIDLQAVRDTLKIPTLARVGMGDEMPQGADNSQYSDLHRMLANLQIDSDVIGSASGAASGQAGQQIPQQTGVM